jgi:hypothetical protein
MHAVLGNVALCASRLSESENTLNSPFTLIMSTEHSALWSALHTLELTRRFTSPRVEAAKVYHTNIPGRNVDDAEKTIHQRHQKLASALALIGASSSDARTVTACSVEVSFLKSNDELEGSDDPVGSDDSGGDPAVILRLAQNKGIVGAELVKLQSLVDGLVKEIYKQQPNVWAVKDGASFLVWLRFKFHSVCIQTGVIPPIQSSYASFSRA